MRLAAQAAALRVHAAVIQIVGFGVAPWHLRGRRRQRCCVWRSGGGRGARAAAAQAAAQREAHAARGGNSFRLWGGTCGGWPCQRAWIFYVVDLYIKEKEECPPARPGPGLGPGP
eukprot:scaffold888_cov114-Isochrysis_galbana.AAC.1